MANRRVGRLIAAASLALLIWWEWRRPLRTVRESKLRRDTRNLAVASLAGAAVRLTETPVARALIREGEKRGWGIARQRTLNTVEQTLVSVLLLDYTLYVWHVMTHRVPLLWRFHQVHHIDREMDASTALRFHFGEMLLSVPFRAAQILLIGPSAQSYSLWQTFLLGCILFHHSNARLPPWLEKRLALLITTPRLHGIHHSVLTEEVNSNWSSGLTVWDYLHGTLRTGSAQPEPVLGVMPYRTERDVVLPRLLAIPFERR